MLYCIDIDGRLMTLYKADVISDYALKDVVPYCDAKGLIPFIPRTKAHLDAVLDWVGDEANKDKYLKIFGVIPKWKGATCKNTYLTSSNSACQWTAWDRGRFYVQDYRTNISEPNGDNDVDSSMYYDWNSDNTIHWYNDIVSPGYKSKGFICMSPDDL